MTAQPTQAARTAYRAEDLIAAYDRGGMDGCVTVVDNTIGDLLVDNGAIRDAIHVLSAHAAGLGMPTLVYTLARQVEAVDAPGGPKARIPSGITDRTPTTVAIDIVHDFCMREPTPYLMVIDFIEHHVPQDDVQGASGDAARIVEQIQAFTTDRAWQRAGHRLVLVGRTEIVGRRVVRLPGVRVAELGRPRLDERREAIELTQGSQKHPLCLGDSLDLERTARLTGGMSLHTLSEMRYHTTPDRPLEVADIVTRKRIAIRQAAGDTLVIHDEPLDFDADVAGLQQVRLLLLEERRRSNDTLRVILAGPPGNGKTRVSTAIAARLGVPAIEFGRIRGRYVGESEDNMRRALDTIEANAPALIIIDEADQAGLGRRGESAGVEGSEVTANLRAALYSWLGDVGSQKGISVIGLTNRPDLLDEAAVDRFTILPVLPPSPWEAAQIMAIQARREGIDLDGDAAALALLEAQATISGRHAVRLVGRAQVHAQAAGRDRIEGGDVAAAVAESLQGMGAEDERQALLAIRATSWSGHLPWNAARHLGDDSAVPPAYLARFVRPDGGVDKSALTDRINELGARRGY